MVVNNKKIYEKTKNKSWLSIEKNITICGGGEKMPCYNYEKLFWFREFSTFR